MTQPIGESMHDVIKRFDKVVSILLSIPSVKKVIDMNNTDGMDTEDQGAESKRFCMIRNTDVSGISGTGKVIEGVVFPSGKVALEWQTSTSSISIYDSIDDTVEIHGHDGATELIWIDE